MSKNDHWSGLYKDTNEANFSVEEHLKNAIEGKYSYPSGDGGTIREEYRDDGSYRIDIYEPSDSKKGHSHDRYDTKEGKPYHHD